MASLSDQSRVRELFDRMTLGVVRSLEKRPGVTDVRLLDRHPAEKQILHTWEQKNMCILPEDLKSFYLTTNGLLIQWCIKFDGSVLPLGRMEINPVAGMVALTKSQSSLNDEKPSLADLDTDGDEKDSQGHTKPHFDNRSKVFELDPCDGYGKICLIYKDVKAGVTTSKPEIWYLDRCLDWWFIADSFTDFFRIMIMHLGLPQWQYVFTDAGISPETKQWFNMYAPVRLEVDSDIQSMENNPRTSGMPVNSLDINRLFRGKSDKNRSKQTQAKRPAAAKHPQNAPQSRGSLGTRVSQR